MEYSRVTKRNHKMTFCHICGIELEDGDNFCVACGAATKKPVAKKQRWCDITDDDTLPPIPPLKSLAPAKSQSQSQTPQAESPPAEAPHQPPRKHLSRRKRVQFESSSEDSDFDDDATIATVAFKDGKANTFRRVKT